MAKPDYQNEYMAWIIIETFVSQVKDPDVMGKMVHDTWNEMSGGIKVRIKKFENLFCICRDWSHYYVAFSRSSSCEMVIQLHHSWATSSIVC